MSSPASDVFREELAYFEEHCEELLRDHEGKFALVKGRELIDTFDTAENAYVAGVERFGNEPFLVKPIVQQEPTAQVPVLSLGLLSAHP